MGEGGRVRESIGSKVRRCREASPACRVHRDADEHPASSRVFAAGVHTGTLGRGAQTFLAACIKLELEHCCWLTQDVNGPWMFLPKWQAQPRRGIGIRRGSRDLPNGQGEEGAETWRIHGVLFLRGARSRLLRNHDLLLRNLLLRNLDGDYR